MEIQIENIDNTTVIKLSGSLNNRGLDALAAQMISLVEEGRNLILDLSEVDFISDKGIQFLFELQDKCAQEGIKLALSGPSDKVYDTLSKAMFAKGPLPVYASFEDGLARVHSRGYSRDRAAMEESAEESTSRGAPSYSAPKMVEKEDVNFSAYYPKELSVEKWYTLLVYTFVPSALETVRRDAERFKDEIGEMRESQSASPTKLVRGTEISLVPTCKGVIFNPERISFEWLEDQHRAQFRLKADASMADMAGNGTVTVYVGPVIGAILKMGMLFNAAEASLGPESSGETTTQMYREDEIFMSYSHRDTDIVLNCQKAYEALGFSVLIDRDTLRSGQKWNDELMRMIERADIFQLFWSENTSKSEYCRQEWQHALGCNKGVGFIRPVYWQEPITKPPPELNDLHFDFAPFVV